MDNTSTKNIARAGVLKETCFKTEQERFEEYVRNFIFSEEALLSIIGSIDFDIPTPEYRIQREVIELDQGDVTWESPNSLVGGDTFVTLISPSSRSEDSLDDYQIALGPIHSDTVQTFLFTGDDPNNPGNPLTSFPNDSYRLLITTFLGVQIES